MPIFTVNGKGVLYTTSKNYAVKISLVYLLFGILWILLSDSLIGFLSLNREIVIWFSVIKGWIFVGLSALLIYIVGKRYMQKLANANQLQQEILQAMPDLILRIDSQGIFIDYNKPPDFDLYVSPKQFLGKSVFDVFPQKIAERAIEHIKNTIISGKIQLIEYQLPQNSKVHYFEARFVKSGEAEVMAIVREITYKKQIEQRLEFLSLNDSLTEVHNRAYFEEQIRKIRSNDGENPGIIVCDVDGLKLINDALGHFAGDQLLKAAAQILSSCTFFPDVIARIGGDEFAIIVSNPKKQKMNELARTIKIAVEKYNQSNPKLPLSLSCGWAIGSEDISVLFKEADNNMYREKMRKGIGTHSAVVQAMIRALETRDYITEGHAERVEILIEEFAQKMQLADSMIADLKLLAKFHDIGKVGIPDDILFNPGKLTADESTVLRRHCDIGFRIAKSVPDLAPIADWILKHHEWWNGKGYPLNLVGEEIPLACRMLAIADAFDAMTNYRPYRKAMNYQEAINELQRCAGTQFDPVLTESFIEIITNLPT